MISVGSRSATPSHEAVTDDHIKLIRELLPHQDINMQTCFGGKTPHAYAPLTGSFCVTIWTF